MVDAFNHPFFVGQGVEENASGLDEFFRNLPPCMYIPSSFSHLVASLLPIRKDSPVEHINNERSHYYAFKKEFYRNLHAIEQMGTETLTGSSSSVVLPVVDNVSFLLNQYNELGLSLEVCPSYKAVV